MDVLGGKRWHGGAKVPMEGAWSSYDGRRFPQDPGPRIPYFYIYIYMYIYIYTYIWPEEFNQVLQFLLSGSTPRKTKRKTNVAPNPGVTDPQENEKNKKNKERVTPGCRTRKLKVSASNWNGSENRDPKASAGHQRPPPACDGNRMRSRCGGVANEDRRYENQKKHWQQNVVKTRRRL